MKIFGIGTDIVNVKRIESLIKKNKGHFIDRVFSQKEILYCKKRNNHASYYAKRFAAKEAFSKALGVGFRQGLILKNIEVINNKAGKPLIKLKGRNLALLKKKIKNKKFQIDLSLSDDKPWAHATVIISYVK